MRIRPLDIESRGRDRRRNSWPLRPGFWPVATSLGASLLSTGVGWYNSSKRKRGNTPSPNRSLIRVGDSAMPRSVSRGRSRTRTTSRARSVSMRSRSRSMFRSRSRSGGIISRQRDQASRFIGSGRRGLRRRRVAYRIQNTLCRMEPLQTWTAKGAINLTSGVNLIGVYGVGLFHTSQTDQPDLSLIATDAGMSGAGSSTQRMWIKNACLDLEIKNTGSVECIMDVYTLLMRRDPSTTNDTGTQWSNFFNDQQTLTGKAPLDVSNSVFQNPSFCQHYKVLSKREVLILPGEFITMQMRRGKDKFVQNRTISDNLCGLEGACKLFFLMFHGAPDPTAGGGGTPAVASTTLTATWQKSYTYALVPSSRLTAQIHNS